MIAPGIISNRLPLGGQARESLFRGFPWDGSLQITGFQLSQDWPSAGAWRPINQLELLTILKTVQSQTPRLWNKGF